MPWVAERAPGGWKAVHHRGDAADALGYEPLSDDNEIYPFVCPIIEDPDELKRILRHLIKIGRSPPGLDPDRLN